MGHVVLLGDSILDNAAYVNGGDSIASQLRARLSREWQVTLLAQDGAVAEGVVRQLLRLPEDATHLVISAGGNDALESTPIINSPTPDSESCLTELLEAVTEFSRSYSAMVTALRQRQLRTVLCTIYDAVPGLRPLECMALSLFNDIIVRQATTFRYPLIDLRRVCTETKDYSSVSPIEPSEVGGAKIARAIQSVIIGYDFNASYSAVFP